MATAVANYTGSDTKDGKSPEIKILPGVMAGVEVSFEPDWTENDKDHALTEAEINALKEMNRKAAVRDTPARLIEVIQSWEAALFYRGFQFLIPLRGGGWKIPGESTGYGPSMQMDLSLLPSNIYSAYAQIVISSLTRSVPNVRFEAQDGSNDAEITAAQSANKFIKVFYRNIDPIVVQTDASRYLWCDGRFLYWTRYVLDGQRFGWKENDQPNDIVPENEPTSEQAESMVAAEEEKEIAGTEGDIENKSGSEEESDEDFEEATAGRTPNGQEVRTAHGKLEVKLVPMMANNLHECDALQYETEVDVSRAKAMFPKNADKIKAGDMGISEASIARLARQNVKLGMQATYITSDSVSEDVTLQRTWFRQSALMWIQDAEVRNSLIKKFPDGVFTTFAGTAFISARNESMDDSWALGQAYSGDGQNRNALGTSLMPIQKRINNWLDLLNDYLVRGIPKIWMDNKAFNVDAIRNQTNVPGDRGVMKRQGVDINQLVYEEPQITAPAALTDFIKDYRGPFAELVSGGYPALAGGQTDTDTFRGMALQRDQALGRLGPTWHQIQQVEATSGKQGVRWASKMRKGTVNERVAGGEVIRLEVNDMKANISCFAESDENFPESYPQKQQRLMGLLEDSAKNPQLQEVLYNAANLQFMLAMAALPELYIAQIASWEKQSGELEILIKQKPIPNPQLTEGQTALAELKKNQNVDPAQLQQVEVELAQLEKTTPLVSSLPIDAQIDDNDTEAMCCWKFITSPEGRRMKRTNPDNFSNVRLHFLEHQAASQAKAASMPPPAQKKVPTPTINWKDVAASGDKSAADQILGEAGIKPGQEPAPSPGAPGQMPQLPGAGGAAGAPVSA